MVNARSFVLHLAPLSLVAMLLVVLNIIVPVVSAADPTPTALLASFIAVGPMTTPRSGHSSTLLPNGNILLAGGQSGDSTIGQSAEVYDHLTSSFSAISSMTYRRANHTSSLLQDGRVLIAGGFSSAYDWTSSVAPAELFDPMTNAFSIVGPMNHRRYDHIAVTLPNGKVLVAGGVGDNQNRIAVAELYDPVTRAFSLSGSLNLWREVPRANLLDNGKVLITGGTPSYGYYDGTAAAEVFDPDNETFTYVGSMNAPRLYHSATKLLDGRVLIVGGMNGTNFSASAEIYSPLTQTFAMAGSLHTARAAHAAVLLSDGRVLVAGGYVDMTNRTATAEIFDPATGAFISVDPMQAATAFSEATRLQSGNVLLTGGRVGPITSINPTSLAELFQPGSGLGAPSPGLQSAGGVAERLLLDETAAMPEQASQVDSLPTREAAPAGIILVLAASTLYLRRRYACNR